LLHQNALRDKHNELLHQNALRDKHNELMTVWKEKNFIGRGIHVCFATQCSYGAQAEHLFIVAENAKKRFQVDCT
jgi:hypothetical protein